MKKIFILLTCLMIFVILSKSANAATVTWDGGGSDNSASDPYNWSGNMLPQNGDNVAFNSTSKNADWNLSVTLSSLTKTSGYTGEITKTAGVDLTVGRYATWTGNGADELASNSANWAGNTVPVSGDRILFDGSVPAKNCIWDINIAPSIFVLSSDYAGVVTLNANLALSGSLTVSGGTLALNNKSLTVDGYLLINAGGTIDASASTITVMGNWANYGNFNPGTSTVILAGTQQTIYGNTTFYNLIKTTTVADTLYFQAGSTQTIINSLTLQGADSNLLSLRSTQDGQYWYINPQGARNISYADIKDMYNSNFTSIVFIPVSNVTNSGNNAGVSFGGSQCVCIPPLQRGDGGVYLSQIIGGYWRVKC